MAFSTYDKVLYGGMGLAGASAYLGLKHGDQDRPAEERIKTGLKYTAGAVAGTAALSAYGFKRAGSQAFGLGKSYFSTVARNTKAAPGMFGKIKVVGTLPVAGGIGAVIGASLAGEDHRKRGAAIGAGVGVTASLALHGADLLKKVGPVGRAAATVGLIGAAFGAGEMMNHSPVAAAAIPDDTGEMQYDSPDAAAAYDSGVGRRARNMNASGGIVLGSHNKRHG